MTSLQSAQTGPVGEGRASIVVVIGFFDIFSGYQEIGLVRALAAHHDVHVVTSDRVNPIFSDEHIRRLGMPRRYPAGSVETKSYRVTRLPAAQFRAMLLARRVSHTIESLRPNIVLQMMPGQLLPALGTPATRNRPSATVFGDNRAMWAGTSAWKRLVKGGVFWATKGSLYRCAARHADVVFGYTPDTLKRVAPYVRGHRQELLPLAFDESVFFMNDDLRESMRSELAIAPDQEVILLVGKYARQKRFEEAVAAFGRLLSRQDRLVLLVVGPSPDDLSHAVAAANIPSASVRVLPFSSPARLNALINAADVAIWPAMPAITIQQAMGTGLYVVLPENDLVGHLVRSETTGSKVKGLAEASPEQLAEVLTESLRRAHAGSRRERAQENTWLSSSALAERIIRLLL